MSDVRTCPTCGAKAKYKLIEEKETYTAVQEEAVFKKISQLKKAIDKYKSKAEALEKEIQAIKSDKK
ncbi:hypothetical protein ACFS5M_07615 [Lacinutrix iliipiscaria]|uniref:Uncharacterized protein n=1 Tax=Lacinutrix iliipiscaria TaxID=1230532 RepID=A0ABW5WMQ2_9FLAO